MSSIFSKLLDEGDKQRQQIEQLEHPANTELFSGRKQSVLEKSSEEKQKSSEVKPEKSSPRHSDVPTVVQNDAYSESRSDVPKFRRPTERVAFDLYKDQAQAIRRLRAERELSGERRVSLSDIAREAMDMFLKNTHQSE